MPEGFIMGLERMLRLDMFPKRTFPIHCDSEKGLLHRTQEKVGSSPPMKFLLRPLVTLRKPQLLFSTVGATWTYVVRPNVQ